MKFFLTLILLVVTHLTFGQTKKETIDWLNSKFPENPYIYGTFFKETQTMKINTDGSFEIEAIIHKQPLLDPPIAETTTRLKGNLKDFSLNSVKVQDIGEGGPKLFLIILTCLNSKNCVIINQTGKSGINYDKKSVRFGAFMKEEENISERLIKAFKHLITLSGGKKETF